MESAEPAETAYQRPVPLESWLDEPYEQWVLETPALTAAGMPAGPTKVTPKRDNGGATSPRSNFPPMRTVPARAHQEAAAAD